MLKRIPDNIVYMRTTLDLPEGLVDEARTSLGYSSKTDTVVFALREVVRRSRLEELKTLMRRVEFDVDPAAVRKSERRRR